MSIKTDIHWCDSTVNPEMGCLGCELFSPPEVVLECIDAAIARVCARAKGQTREIFTRLIYDAYDRIPDPGLGHVRAVINTNIWNLREQFCEEIARRFNKPAAKAAMQAIQKSLKCYAWKLHIVRGQDITDPSRLGNTGYAPMFERVTQFPGRVATAAAYSDLLGLPHPGKPWLDGLPRVIFVSDMGDALSRVSDFDFLEEDMIPAISSEAGLKHLWLWLSKRPTNMARFSQRIGGFPPNLCAMTTVTGPATLHRIDQLREVQAEVKGLSIEPLLELIPMELLDLSGIDWVVLGGESGAKKAVTTFDVRTVREMIEHCRERGVGVFVKQLGAKSALNGAPLNLKDSHGADWTEWPADIRVRQFPGYFHNYRPAQQGAVVLP